MVGSKIILLIALLFCSCSKDLESSKTKENSCILNPSSADFFQLSDNYISGYTCPGPGVSSADTPINYF